MNNSIKKILYIGLPIVMIMIAVSVIFYVKTSQFAYINRSTTKSELISYSVVEGSFSSEETVESTEDNRIYQTKVILNIHNMAKYDLGNFDINIKFIEEGNDEPWIYTQEDFSFLGDSKLIVTSTREYKAIVIDNIYVQFADEPEEAIYIYSSSEYDNLFGEDNEIVSPTTLKIYKTLTIACISFTIVIAIAIALLILVYTRPDDEVEIEKVSVGTKRNSEVHSKKESDNKATNKKESDNKNIKANSTSHKKVSNSKKTTKTTSNK